MSSAESGGPPVASGGAAPWSTDPAQLPRFHQTGEEVVARGWFITVARVTFDDPDGRSFERTVVRHPGAVAIVPITEDGSVLLVRQFRPAVNRWILEIPAGTRDVDGEPAEVTAHRELAEEVGRAAGALTLLTRCVITPGFCDEFATLYLATDLTTVPTDRQGTEEQYLTVVEVPLAEFDGLVDDGTIIDASTILGVALARRRLAVTE